MTTRYRSADDRAIHTGTYFNGTIPPGSTTSRNDNCGEERACTDVIGNFPNVNPFESDRKWTIRARLSGSQYDAAGTTLLRKLTSFPIDRVATARDPRSYYGSLDIPTIQSLLRDLLNKTSPSNSEMSLPTFLGELKDFIPLLTPTPNNARFLAALQDSAGFYKRALELGRGMGKGSEPIFQLLKRLSRAQYTEQVRSIPWLIRAFGNTLIGWAANGYISWRWIVKPMVHDLRIMSQFVQAVDKRRRFLEALNEGGPVRRRVGLSADTSIVAQPEVFGSTGQGFSLKYLWKIKYSERVWGTAKWRLDTSTVPLPKDDGTSNRAFRLTFGLTAFELLKTAWELFPWSWFADWFGDIGNNIALYNNTVPAYWADACVMRTLTSVAEYTIKPGTMPAWVAEVQPIVETWTRKERYNDISLWLPLLPTAQPLLDSGKWSILSALAASSVDRGLPAFFKRFGR